MFFCETGVLFDLFIECAWPKYDVAYVCVYDRNIDNTQKETRKPIAQYTNRVVLDKHGASEANA